jgi:tetratricopeptide (TPR) repeat protein
MYRLLLLLLLPLSAFSQAADNAELSAMFREDQRSRMVPNIDWAELSKADSVREARVNALIGAGQVVTGQDHFHAAMIFQHGRDPIAYEMAVKHMRKAIALDTSINRWLLAAAIDRELMSRDKPQIYGTQYTKRGDSEKWVRYQIDSTKVTDAERTYYGVETLAAQRIKERNMNLQPISAYYSKGASMDKVIAFIKAESKKGNQSAYDVSEDGINTFGYELMAGNKVGEAEKVMRLNTLLFPKSFNVFDSYGECLLKLNRKEEGLQAYRKSLELNPKNGNARKILAEQK